MTGHGGVSFAAWPIWFCDEYVVLRFQVRSSGVEHFLDTEGASGSNPLAPTISLL